MLTNVADGSSSTDDLIESIRSDRLSTILSSGVESLVANSSSDRSSSLIERLFVVGGGGDEDDAMIGGESIGEEGDGVDLVDVISFGIGGVLGASVE